MKKIKVTANAETMRKSYEFEDVLNVPYELSTEGIRCLAIGCIYKSIVGEKELLVKIKDLKLEV